MKKKRIKSIIEPQKATNKEVKWASDSKEVATVSNEGVIKAHDVGDAVITVTSVCNGIQEDAVVSVPYVPPESIELNHNKLDIYLKGINSRARLEATVLPSNTSYKDIVWETSNDNVLVKNGMVEACRNSGGNY